MAIKKELSCSCCSGSNLCYGYMGMSANSFVPGGFFSGMGLRTRSFVCLDCGVIGQFIDGEKLARLNEKIKNQYM